MGSQSSFEELDDELLDEFEELFELELLDELDELFELELEDRLELELLDEFDDLFDPRSDHPPRSWSRFESKLLRVSRAFFFRNRTTALSSSAIAGLAGAAPLTRMALKIASVFLIVSLLGCRSLRGCQGGTGCDRLYSRLSRKTFRAAASSSGESGEAAPIEPR